MRNSDAMHEPRVIKAFIPSKRDLRRKTAKQVLRACGAQDDMPRGFFRERKEERG
jgi:hypothetical protein